jgi:hypothetical protein
MSLGGQVPAVKTSACITLRKKSKALPEKFSKRKKHAFFFDFPIFLSFSHAENAHRMLMLGART